MARIPSSRRRRDAGFTLIEIMIASAIVTVIALAIAQLILNATRTQRQANLEATALTLKNSITQDLNNGSAWTNTVAAPLNEANSSTTCLTTTTAQCTSDGTAMAPVGTGVPFGANAADVYTITSAIPIQQIYDAANNLAFDLSKPTNGFTAQGTPCTNFVAPPGLGTTCVFHYSVMWATACNKTTSSCASPQVFLYMKLTYNPEKYVTLNPQNYDVENGWFQGSTGLSCWTYAGGYLYETCGNVGVMTTAPTAPLSVVSTSAGLRTNYWGDVNASSCGLAGIGQNVYLNQSDNSFRWANTHGSLGGSMIELGQCSGPQWNDIVFYRATGPTGGIPTTANNVAPMSESMRIQASTGNVGIGVSTPGAPLEVDGAGTNPTFIVKRTDIPGTMTLYTDGGGAGGAFLVLTGNTGSAGAQIDGGGDHNSYIGANGGYLGVGTNAPSQPLQVVAAAGNSFVAQIQTLGSNAYLTLADQNGSNTISDSGSALYIGGNGPGGNIYIRPIAGYGVGATFATDGSLTVTGNASATAFYYTSDINLKKDIEPLSSKGSVLDRLETLNGVYFSWKKNNEKSIGVIAQDVNKDFPELVDKKDNSFWTVNYGGLVGVVIEAVKELKALFLQHDARLDQLEQENLELNARLSKLEKECQSQ